MNGAFSPADPSYSSTTELAAQQKLTHTIIVSFISYLRKGSTKFNEQYYEYNSSSFSRNFTQHKVFRIVLFFPVKMDPTFLNLQSGRYNKFNYHLIIYYIEKITFFKRWCFISSYKVKALCLGKSKQSKLLFFKLCSNLNSH